MRYEKQMYIGGKLVDGQATKEVINPATEEVVGLVAAAGKDDIAKALNAARDALPTWGKSSIETRQEWMHKLRDEVIANQEYLRECVHYEMGKSWAGTQEDFDLLERSLAFYAEEITRIRPEMIVDRAGTHTHTMVHEPVGVAVAYLAWNFPLLNLAYKIGPALAAGCPMVVRVSEATPISAYAVGELCAKIGLPDGVLNILTTADYDSADALAASEIPALLTLIGSASTAKHITRVSATSVKRYSMELGGNAPVLVFEDADLELAADIVCGVKFNNSGQICVTPNRVFVEESIREKFTEMVVERAKDTRVGFDKNQPIVTGPMIDGRAWNRVHNLVQDAVADGASVLAGGGRPQGLDKGHFYAPTVLGDVTSDMRIYQEEIFGPIVSLIGFTDHDDLLARANDGEDGGLSSYIFTRDLAKADRFAREMRYGEIQINGVKYDIDLPHGGIGQSGVGHDCSHLALYDYLAVKRISRAV